MLTTPPCPCLAGRLCLLEAGGQTTQGLLINSVLCTGVQAVTPTVVDSTLMTGSRPLIPPNQVPQNWLVPFFVWQALCLSSFTLTFSLLLGHGDPIFLIFLSIHFEKKTNRKSTCWMHQAAFSNCFYFSIEGTSDNKTVFQEAPRVLDVPPTERASSSLCVS